MKYKVTATRYVHVTHIVDASSEEDAYEQFYMEEGEINWEGGEEVDDSSVEIDAIAPVEEKYSNHCAGCYGG